MSWTDAGYSRFGYATYRLAVNTNERELSIYIPNINDASIVWVNGEKIYQAGKVSAVLSERVLRLNTSTCIFLTDNGHFEIIIQVSNLAAIGSGLVHAVKFGRSSLLLTDIIVRYVILCLYIGFAFAVFIYHMTLFMYRSDEKIHLIFSINCLFNIVRLIFDTNGLASFLLPQGLNIIMCQLFLIMASAQGLTLILFSHSIFKIRFDNKLINAVYVAVLFISLLVALLPFGTINPQISIVAVIPLLILFVRALQLQRLREKPYNLLYLFSIFAFCF
jgi:two-component system sensor histidine kinase ChiS